jgi:hypothetical protein
VSVGTQMPEWYREADRAVEREAERLRHMRSAKFVLFILAMGAVLGFLIESQTHLCERFLEWLG